jgi:hypothetical protein
MQDNTGKKNFIKYRENTPENIIAERDRQKLGENLNRAIQYLFERCKYKRKKKILHYIKK